MASPTLWTSGHEDLSQPSTHVNKKNGRSGNKCQASLTIRVSQQPAEETCHFGSRGLHGHWEKVTGFLSLFPPWFYLFEAQLIYNVLLSSVQQSDSVLLIYAFLFVFFP